MQTNSKTINTGAWRNLARLFATALLVAACSNDKAGSPVEPTGTGAPACSAASGKVEDTLHCLGVPLDTGARIDATGNSVADSFSPLGDVATIWKANKLFVLGLPYPTTPGSSSDGASLIDEEGATIGATGLGDVAPAPLPSWANGTNADLRAVAAADVDGDGTEEVVLVSGIETPGTPTASNNVNLTVIRGPGPAFSFSAPTLLTTAVNLTGLSVAAADLDGDGQPDLVVGVVAHVATQGSQNGAWSSQGQLLFFHNDHGAFTLDAKNTKTFAAQPGEMAIVLAPARLDRDRASELAVVVNTSDEQAGSSHYYVYDDAGTGYASLGDGAIATAAGTAAAGDVAAGDIDGDGLDELVLAGPTTIRGGASSNGNCRFAMVGIALDDATAGLAPLGQLSRTGVNWCHESTDDAFNVAWTPVRMLQVDADANSEILVGDVVYDDFANGGPFHRIGALQGNPGGTNGVANVPVGGPFVYSSAGTFNPGTSAVIAAEMGKPDTTTGVVSFNSEVIVYSQDSNRLVRYTVMPATDTDSLGGGCLPTTTPGSGGSGGADAGTGSGCGASDIITYQPSELIQTNTTSGSGDAQHALLLPVDITGDSLTVARNDQSHKLVFTSPIVIAALATPPCETGIGQNTDACSTGFAVSSTKGIGDETEISSSIGVTAGIHVDGTIVGDIEATASVTATASQAISNAYSLTQQVSYQTGAMEDSVVFATVPYDQYDYLVLSGPHTGTTMTVSVPREPVIMMAERNFYNAALTPDGLHIDDKVFTHTPGDITTYPTAADKNRLLAGGAGIVAQGPQAVEQGGGSITLTDTVEHDSTKADTLGLDFSVDVQATAGVVLAGFSVGTGVSDTLSVSMGSSTAYSGTVGSIGGNDFDDHFYQFGIYVYAQTDAASGQQFQVVNYWVQD